LPSYREASAVTAGRKPKPTHLKLLAGKPGHRALPENEPQPAELDAFPDPPAHLSGTARAEWDRTLPLLRKNKIITEIDLNAFAAYCQAYGRWQEAEAEVAKQGMVVLAPSGFPVQNPYLAVANKALEQMAKLQAEFGMTPSSRTRVSMAGVGRKKNRFTELKNGAKASAKRA
jgi:P27 family predicted phage terminase small subunit